MFLILGQLRCRNGEVRIDKMEFWGGKNLNLPSKTVNWKFHPSISCFEHGVDVPSEKWVFNRDGC